VVPGASVVSAGSPPQAVISIVPESISNAMMQERSLINVDFFIVGFLLNKNSLH
jgi:hypothetical protein